MKQLKHYAKVLLSVFMLSALLTQIAAASVSCLHASNPVNHLHHDMHHQMHSMNIPTIQSEILGDKTQSHMHHKQQISQDSSHDCCDLQYEDAQPCCDDGNCHCSVSVTSFGILNAAFFPVLFSHQQTITIAASTLSSTEQSSLLRPPKTC